MKGELFVSVVSCASIERERGDFHESEECFEPLEDSSANEIAEWRGSVDPQTSIDSIKGFRDCSCLEEPPGDHNNFALRSCYRCRRMASLPPLTSDDELDWVMDDDF
jgi:hypothetical protein